MKTAVAWNGTPLLTPLTGVGQYTLQLIRALHRQSLVDDLQVFMAHEWRSAVELDRGPARQSRERVPAMRVLQNPQFRKWVGALPGMRALARARQASAFSEGCRSNAFALYHEPNFVAFPFDGPLVVTVHDLSFVRHPETHPKDRVRFMTQGLPLSLERAQRVVVVSEFVRKEVQQVFGTSIANKTVVIPNGVAPEFHPVEPALAQAHLENLGLKPGAYLLALGTLEPRKNILALLEAYTLLPKSLKQRYPLVLAGAEGWKTGAIARRLHALRHEPICTLGFVDQDLLPALYSGARGFVYPSTYEGFGLPVLESMACGSPTLVSLAPALIEVQAGAGLSADPQDPPAFARAMTQLLEDEPSRLLWQAAGHARARALSWDLAAQRLAQVYQQVVRA
jgi:alpha-1,3-rhamnosyl/mannosyltransferase